MAWENYQRLLFWALSRKWISEWAFRDLLSRAYQREAAQLTARKMLNRLKRQTSPPSVSREQIAQCFIEVYLLREREREQALLTRLRVDSEARETARSLGLEVPE